jgi:hypothetical protein
MGFIYSHNKQSWAVEARADASDKTDAKFHAIQGDVAARMLRIIEVMVAGEATSAALALMKLARDSQVATGALTQGSGTSIASLSSGAPTVRASAFDTAATVQPQSSASLHLLQLSLQAFGGVIRWVAAPGQEIYQVGLAANVGETSLDAFTGSGTPTISSHIHFEEL